MKKSNTKEYILYDFIYVNFKKKNRQLRKWENTFVNSISDKEVNIPNT